MPSKNKDTYKTWVEISKKNLLHNLNLFKKAKKLKTKIMYVVKANAYGHGLTEVVSILDKFADWFGVDSIEEAQEIRSTGLNKSILIMGHIPQAQFTDAIEKDISFMVYDKEVLKTITKLNLSKKAKLHLKIETGLHRQGASESKAQKMVKFIRTNSNRMVLEGVYTHFANVEDTLDPSFAMLQIARFIKFSKKVEQVNGKKLLRHTSASAAAMLYPDSHFDLIRIGISMYGLWPSRETQIELKLKRKKGFDLKPVMTWKSVVTQIAQVAVGESVGYGRTWYASRKSNIAVVPVGYYDGYDRKLSNNSKVVINGKYAPVVGRVAMNMFMVDVTDIAGVKKGDEVILLGGRKDKQVTVEYLAEKAETINYEIVSRINPQIKRMVV